MRAGGSRWGWGWRWRAIVVVGIGAPAAVAPFAGCSEILGIQSDRYLDAGAQESSTSDVAPAIDAGADAGEAGAEAGGDARPAEAGPWDCLGQPPQLFDPNATTTVTFLAVDALQPITQAQQVDGGSAFDLLTYTPLPGVPIRGCSTVLHPFCDQGTSTPADGGYETTSDAGTVTFVLPQNWDGFYQFDDSTLFTTTFYPGQMVAGQTSTTVPAPLLTTQAEEELESVLPGVKASHELDGGVGHVLLSVYDCEDHFASGVQIVPGTTLDAGPYPTIQFYTEGIGGQELPTTSADSTDQQGAAGILNVPVGSFVVTAKLKSTGQTVGAVSVFVNPGVAVQLVIRARTE